MNKYELGNEFKENIERLPSLSLKQKVELLENLANEAGDNDIEIVKAIVRTKSVFDSFFSNNKDLKEKIKIKAEINRLQKFFNQDQILDLCEFIQNQLAEVGIQLEININPPSTHRQMVATSKLDFFRGSWIADYADAENYLALFYSKNFCPNGPNYTHFSNPTFDYYYEMALKEVNLEKRRSYYHLMDQMILDEAAIIPLYYDQVIRFVQNDIVGFESNAMNLLKLKSVQKLKP